MNEKFWIGQVHGNMSSRQIAMDEKRFVWLLGFEPDSAQVGPVLTDIARMVHTFMFDSVRITTDKELKKAVDFSRRIATKAGLGYTDLTSPSPSPFEEHPQLETAWRVVHHTLNYGAAFVRDTPPARSMAALLFALLREVLSGLNTLLERRTRGADDEAAATGSGSNNNDDAAAATTMKSHQHEKPLLSKSSQSGRLLAAQGPKEEPVVVDPADYLQERWALLSAKAFMKRMALIKKFKH